MQRRLSRQTPVFQIAVGEALQRFTRGLAPLVRLAGQPVRRVVAGAQGRSQCRRHLGRRHEAHLHDDLHTRTKEYADHIKRYLWGEHFWSPSYFADSCGGAPLAVVKEYIENQKRPG